MRDRRVIGFFINPIAGMGGRVGLKGTDGMVSRALELGAEKVSPGRAQQALEELFTSILKESSTRIEVLTAEAPMGMEVCNKALDAAEKGILKGGNERMDIRSILEPDLETTRDDTVHFCEKACDEGVEIILFAGGDGTARDVVSVVGEEIPILGIPSGVKMHSGVFTYRPGEAGHAVFSFLMGRSPLGTRDVMDLDEDAYRAGSVQAKLYGYASVPVTTTLQGCKNIIVAPDEEVDRRSIALGLEEFFQDHPGLYIMGAGSTLRDIGSHFGMKFTPLGFDIVEVGLEDDSSGTQRIAVVKSDVNEAAILETIKSIPRNERFIVVTPIGAQGFILGRGTQVISEKVLGEIPLNNIIVVATPGKLAITETLRVDVGGFNEKLTGFRKVLVGYRRFVLKKVA